MTPHLVITYFVGAAISFHPTSQKGGEPPDRLGNSEMFTDSKTGGSGA